MAATVIFIILSVILLIAVNVLAYMFKNLEGSQLTKVSHEPVPDESIAPETIDAGAAPNTLNVAKVSPEKADNA